MNFLRKSTRVCIHLEFSLYIAQHKDLLRSFCLRPSIYSAGGTLRGDSGEGKNFKYKKIILKTIQNNQNWFNLIETNS